MRKTMRFADGSELKLTLSSSLPVSVRAISWQPSVVWTLLRAGIVINDLPDFRSGYLRHPADAQAGTTVYLVW